MRRRVLLTTVVLGALVSWLAGSGLVSLTADTVRFGRSTVLSGTFTPANHDVEAATVAPTDPSCGGGAFSDAPTTILVSAGAANLGTGAVDDPASDICVKNAGTGTGRLFFSLDSIVNTENGCPASEATVDPDGATCGSLGELTPLLRGALAVFAGGTSGSCAVAPQASFASLVTTPVQVDASIAAGETCRFRLSLDLDTAASDTAKLAAQNDTTQFDVVFTLQD